MRLPLQHMNSGNLICINEKESSYVRSNWTVK